MRNRLTAPLSEVWLKQLWSRHRKAGCRCASARKTKISSNQCVKSDFGCPKTVVLSGRFSSWRTQTRTGSSYRTSPKPNSLRASTMTMAMAIPSTRKIPEYQRFPLGMLEFLFHCLLVSLFNEYAFFLRINSYYRMTLCLDRHHWHVYIYLTNGDIITNILKHRFKFNTLPRGNNILNIS